MIRKAFKLAQTERPGAVYLAVPEDVEKAPAPTGAAPLAVNVPRPDEPSPSQLERAAARAAEARATRSCSPATEPPAPAPATALRRFAETLGVPVATTFHGKGVFPDDHPQALGAVGFMRHDYVNFGFDEADVIVAVGYELQEFDPVRINPDGDKKIIHIHRFPAEVDVHYEVEVGLQADIGRTLDALADAVERPLRRPIGASSGSARCSRQSWSAARADDRFPLAPARIVADTRAALGREDIVLVDTGALKMWMARLYPTYEPNTCLISNGLSTMAWTVPGAIGAKLARPDARVLVATGDGGVHDELAGDRDGAARADPVRDPDLGRRRVRADQVEDGPGARARTATQRSAIPTSSPTPRASARAATGSRRPTSCCPTLRAGARGGHRVGDRLPGRLLGQPAAHRRARRARRVDVLKPGAPRQWAALRTAR